MSRTMRMMMMTMRAMTMTIMMKIILTKKREALRQKVRRSQA